MSELERVVVDEDDPNEPLLQASLNPFSDEYEQNVQQKGHWCCRPPSNVALLTIVCVLFSSFALAEIFAAIASHSLSLFGDAVCMVVDSITYGLNMVAEYKKEHGGISETTRLKLEFYIPLLSVTALGTTSIYLLVEAVSTIEHPPSHDEKNAESTSDKVMLVFSSVNLAVDIASLFCFARVNKLLGFDSVDHHHDGGSVGNTNMCSAYTHVIADTVRSVAVLIAAAYSLTHKNVNAELADAW
eukprot:CAMPEP_0203759484 /NCGR_PEP_ID=MMETSP0098-20131031/12542_1 /ASSEMBLY_ACC=CAM_ASM_000208 /TAXON_ID=96639 /ORGANISM=" , Strain NY0313808BC1" /LENGTH=242 /DNA_ID=CAMNT_0050652487 /DNA_START=117 /DNA_END=842 /DNA_ORIENTATION=+